MGFERVGQQEHAGRIGGAMHDSEDPRIKIAEENFIGLGRWLSTLEQLSESTNDQLIAKALLKSAHRAYAHLRIGANSDLTYCAWACRNLLELHIFTRYLIRSVVERKRFIDHFYIDYEQQAKAQEKYIVQLDRAIGLDANTDTEMQVFQSFLNTIQVHKTRREIKENKYLATIEIAKEVRLEEEFASMNKVCSKLVHPTALSILAIAFPEHQIPRDALLLSGAGYLKKLLDDILPFTRESFNNPLPWPED